MYQPQYFPALVLSFVFLSTSKAWRYPTNVDLSSPPPLNSGDAVLDGHALVNYSADSTAWPCYNYPVPQDVVRTPFPVSGGRFSFTLTNNTVGSLQDHEYIGDIYIGQISLGDGTYSTASQAPSGMNTGYWGADVYVWKDFSSGPDCSEPVDVVGVIANALGKDGLTAADVVGMNATVGMRIVLFGPNPNSPYVDLEDFNVEEMDQCGYVTFTDKDLSKDPNAGYCNGGGSPTTSSGPSPPTIVTSRLPSATAPILISPLPRPIPVPGGSPNSATTSSHTHTVAIGAGVGVSMGISLLILIIAVILLRRRKARKHTETIGADIMVSRQQDDESSEGEKAGKKTEKGNRVESSASSTHSEPLPPYAAEEDHNRV